MAGYFRNWCATLPGTLERFPETTVDSNVQLVVDTLRNVDPMQIIVQQRYRLIIQ